jgi:hypothetical protein
MLPFPTFKDSEIVVQAMFRLAEKFEGMHAHTSNVFSSVRSLLQSIVPATDWQADSHTHCPTSLRVRFEYTETRLSRQPQTMCRPLGEKVTDETAAGEKERKRGEKESKQREDRFCRKETTGVCSWKAIGEREHNQCCDKVDVMSLHDVRLR